MFLTWAALAKVETIWDCSIWTGVEFRETRFRHICGFACLLLAHRSAGRARRTSNLSSAAQQTTAGFEKAEYGVEDWKVRHHNRQD
jgi:hypothetical protein